MKGHIRIASVLLFAAVGTVSACADFLTEPGQPRQGIAFLQEWDLLLMDADGTNLRTLIEGREIAGPIWRFTWSPDGSKIAFSSNVYYTDQLDAQELFVADADGGRVRQVTRGAINTSSFSSGKLQPVWSPDGTRIAYLGKAGYHPYGIHVVTLDGLDYAVVTDEPGVPAPLPDDRGLAWSPDGARIAYRCMGPSNWNICVVNADGTGAMNLTAGRACGGSLCGESQPQWSPDGTRIVFQGDGYDEPTTLPSDIFVVSADGTGMVNLTNTPDDSEWLPLWSPDGGRIAFVTSEPDASRGLKVMRADGTDVIRLNERCADYLLRSDFGFTFSWSPDGTQLLHNCGPLTVVDVDGTGETVLLDFTSRSCAPMPSGAGRAR